MTVSMSEVRALVSQGALTTDLYYCKAARLLERIAAEGITDDQRKAP